MYPAMSKEQFLGSEVLVILLGLLLKTHTLVAPPWLSSVGKAGDGGSLHNFQFVPETCLGSLRMQLDI